MDGCWLKGPMYRTQLLTAVGIDGNNSIFPIAYAIVEKESLIEAFNEVLPYVNHRFCARHLHNNFKRAGFGGFTLKKAFWAAAKATTVKEFDACMVRIRELDPNAVDWLNDKEPSQWSRSHLSSDAKCDILLNNICEVFNSMIFDARDKPIVTLLEKLRYLLMARMLANREKAHKWSSNDVCPKIKDILHKNQTAAGEYIPRKSNQRKYEIIGATIHDSWAVDLENRICSCTKWSIMGIPCKHAIAAIRAKKDNILDYVDDCYKVETYRRIYEHAILSINGPQMWPKSTKVPPLPLTIVGNKKTGRKQKARRKEADEVGASRTKIKRKQQSLDCSTCNKPGHNKKTCKYNVVSQETTSVHQKLHVRRGLEEAGQEKTRQEGAGQEKTVGQEEVVDIDSEAPNYRKEQKLEIGSKRDRRTVKEFLRTILSLNSKIMDYFKPFFPIQGSCPCHVLSLHPGWDRYSEAIAGPKRTLGLAFLTQRKPNPTELLNENARLTTDSGVLSRINDVLDADPGYLCLHHNKMQANWHQYMECTSMRVGKLNHNLSLKGIQENTYLGPVYDHTFIDDFLTFKRTSECWKQLGNIGTIPRTCMRKCEKNGGTWRPWRGAPALEAQKAG
uniref:Mutator transposable element-related protein, putative n=1 Tax=Solanum tuberosum TaxID=4113 RepID=Q0KII7_SOLTU|nr:Mutator transposable element-related protein, putative [Solanum tuberosum]